MTKRDSEEMQMRDFVLAVYLCYCGCVHVFLYICYLDVDIGVKIWRVKSHTSLNTPAQHRGVHAHMHTFSNRVWRKSQKVFKTMGQFVPVIWNVARCLDAVIVHNCPI